MTPRFKMVWLTAETNLCLLCEGTGSHFHLNNNRKSWNTCAMCNGTGVQKVHGPKTITFRRVKRKITKDEDKWLET